MPNSELTLLHALLESNERTVTLFYRLATTLLVLFLAGHLAFSAYCVYVGSVTTVEQAVTFGIFNLAALVVEIYLSRIAFMLGARAGQLRDIHYSLMLCESKADLSRFKTAAQAIMATRRSEAAMKILDVESVVNSALAKVPGAKPAGKDSP